MRYVAIARPPRPRASDDWADRPPIVAAETVYEPDDTPQNTGLFDQSGTPIYRVRDRHKMGYI